MRVLFLAHERAARERTARELGRAYPDLEIVSADDSDTLSRLPETPGFDLAFAPSAPDLPGTGDLLRIVVSRWPDCTVVVLSEDPSSMTTGSHTLEAPAPPHALKLRRNGLADPVTIGTWDRDLETNVAKWSDEFYGFLGLTPGEVPSTLDSLMERIHPDDRQRVAATVEDGIRHRGPFTVVFRVLWPDGTERVIFSSGAAMFNASGRAVRLLGTSQDITGMRTRRKAPKSSREPLLSLAELSPVGMFHTDERGWFRQVNASWCEMAGLTREQCLGDGWKAALHRDDRAGVLEAWERAIREKLPFRAEHRFQRPDGTSVWVFCQAVVEQAGASGPAGYLGTITDITERKHAEEALREGQRRMQALFENAQDAVLLIDADMRYVDANPAACAMFGYTRDELVRLSIGDLTPAPARERIQELSREFEARGRLNGEYVVLRKDGTTCPVEFHAVANIIPGLHLSTLHDVTARKRAEAQLYVRARQQAALARLGEHALAAADHQTLLAEAVTAAAAALEVEYTAIFQLVPEGDHFVIRSGAGWSEGFGLRETVPGGNASLPGYALQVQGPVLVPDLSLETRFRPPAFLVEHGVRSCMAVIIPGRERPYGVLAAYTRERREFTPDEVLFLESMANMLAVAGIRFNEQQIRNLLLDRAIAARDEERQRLARELHDETGQSLTALLIGLVSVEQASTLEETRALASRLRQTAAQTIEDVGRLARGLHPSVLHDMGLARAATRYVEDFQRSYRMVVKLDVLGLARKRLPSAIETTLYRVLQEALTNCARHSRADRVHVKLAFTAGQVELTVVDDGIGFDVGAGIARSPASGGLGLHGMRERVGRVGGTITIDSKRNGGTRLVVHIPINAVALLTAGRRAARSPA